MSPVWNYKALEAALLDPNWKPSGAELKALRASWAWQDTIARKEPWAVAHLAKVKKARLKVELHAKLKRAAKLKKGQVFVLRWPRPYRKNGDRRVPYKSEPASRMFCSSPCIEAQPLDGAGGRSDYAVEVVNAYEVAGQPCASCGRDLSKKYSSPVAIPRKYLKRRLTPPIE